ncbi:hypothetical protein [Streptomyces mesophilus]
MSGGVLRKAVDDSGLEQEHGRQAVRRALRAAAVAQLPTQDSDMPDFT